MKKYNLAPGDFPELDDYRQKMSEQDFTKFVVLKPKLIEDVDQVLGVDLPRLLEALPRPTGTRPVEVQENGPLVYDAPAPPPSFAAAEADNPWANDAGGDNPFGDDEDEAWALQPYVAQYESQFNSSQSGGFVSGNAAKGVLSNSAVPKTALRKIWELSDIDKDGQLDKKEFVVCMYLVDLVKRGQELPARLDTEFIPPEKRR
jgi:EH domain-containing protein 1